MEGPHDTLLDKLPGEKKIERASTVEWDSLRQMWAAHIKPQYGGGSFYNKSRERCIAWEIAELNKWALGQATTEGDK